MTTLTSRTPADIEEVDLLDLLSAYQHLQAQNLRMSTHLSTEVGLSPTDLRALLYLFRTENVSPRDLANLLEHTTGSITVMIDRLEKTGHVQRRPHPTDRRSQIIHLTETGSSAVNYVRDSYQTAFDGVFTGPAIRTAAHTLRSLGDALLPSVERSEPAA